VGQQQQRQDRHGAEHGEQDGRAQTHGPQPTLRAPRSRCVVPARTEDIVPRLFPRGHAAHGRPAHLQRGREPAADGGGAARP
jgi:hypothetical protein